MIYIQHRVNTLEQLDAVDTRFGVEIDLRSDCRSARIHLHHDPFMPGQDFEPWIARYAERGMQGPLILNTKEDGLEQRLIELCEAHHIRNFFFLDTALPTLVKWAIRGRERRFACRYSVYEPLSCLESFRGKVEWVWVDCFDGIPMPLSDVASLRRDFKVCLVAPELQGVGNVDPGFFELLEVADAVCTKQAKIYQSRI